MVKQDRALPHSLDAEAATLGAILVHPQNLPVAASVVSPGDFYREANRTVFAAMLSLHERGQAIDWLLLKEELTRLGQLDEVGGPVYVMGLANGVPKSTNVPFYAGLIREHARRRAAIAAGSAIVTAAYDAEDTAAQVVEDGVAALLRCVGTTGGGLVSADQAIRDYANAIDSGSLGSPVETGYADVDAMLRGGFRPGDLAIVAARPSVGKTSWALGAADHMARHGSRVVFFPLETGQQNIAAKLLGLRARVQTVRLERGEADADEWARVSAVMSSDATDALVIEESATTVVEIGAWCRRAKDAGGLAGCVIDYLQLLSPDRTTDNESRDVAGISRSLKRLAKSLGIFVLAISQLSRSPEARKDKRPHISDLRSSGALEQDADIGILLHREEMHKATADNAGVAECIIAKHRNGPVGVVKLAWRSELAQFANLARD